MRKNPRQGRVALLAACVSGLVVLAGCSGGPDEGEDRGTLAIGVERSPNSFDPLQSFLGGQYMQHLDPVYDTLIRMEPDGSFSPGLATEWSYIDTTTFEMTLREGVVFSDGTTEFNAEAVKANLDRLETVVGPQTSDLAAMYESTEVIDDSNVVIHLSSPNPALERILSQLLGMMVNPNAIDDEDALGENPQGTGPYTLDDTRTVVNNTYFYTENEHYWEPDAYPYSELEIKTYTDQNAMLTALQSGVVSIGYGSPETVDTAEGAGLGVVTDTVNVAWLALNDRDGEIAEALADERVRQALNYAIDREAIVDTVFRGQAEPTAQVFPSGTEGYDPDLNDRYPYDPEEAESLLEEAGYADGFSFTTGLAFPERDSTLTEALASYYSNIGVTMEIEPMPEGSFSAEDHEIFASVVHAMGGQGAYSDGPLLLQPTGTIWNPRDTEREEFDELWREGTNADNDEDRIAAYEELSAEIVEEAWFVPVANTNAIYYFDEDVFADAPFTPQLTVPQMHSWEFAD